MSDPALYNNPPAAEKAIDIEPWERVLVTCSEHWMPVELVEVDRVLSEGECRVLLGCQGDVAVDLVCEDARSVRWWQVVNWCRQEGVNHVPLYYDGAFTEIPKNLLDGEKGAYVCVRRSRRGPWVMVRSPEADKTLEPTPAEETSK